MFMSDDGDMHMDDASSDVTTITLSKEQLHESLDEAVLNALFAHSEEFIEGIKNDAAWRMSIAMGILAAMAAAVGGFWAAGFVIWQAWLWLIGSAAMTGLASLWIIAGIIGKMRRSTEKFAMSMDISIVMKNDSDHEDPDFEGVTHQVSSKIQ